MPMTRKANHKKLFSITDCASKVISTISYTYLSSIKNIKSVLSTILFLKSADSAIFFDVCICGADAQPMNSIWPLTRR